MFGLLLPAVVTSDGVCKPARQRNHSQASECLLPTCLHELGLLRHTGKLAELLNDVWLSLAKVVVLVCDKVVSL